ncbi:MAG: YfhO family protein, partial [Chloroflexota bacterium]
RPLAYLVLAGLIEVGTSAVQVLPSLELSGESIRGGGMSYWDAASFSLPPTTALYTVLPTYPSQLFSEYVGYVGVVPLVLAALALFAWSARPSAVFMAGLVAMGLFMALGKYNPFFPFLFQWVPGLDLFRVPARWLLVYTLGVCGMAGLGAQLLIDLGGRRRRLGGRRIRERMAGTLRLLAAALLLAGAGGLLAIFYRLATPRPAFQEMQLWGALAALTLVLAALAALGRRAGWIVVGLLIALVAGELWAAGEMASVRRPVPFEAYRPDRTSTRYLLEDAATRDGPGRLLSFATDGYEVKETPDYKKQYEGLLHTDALVQFMVNIKLNEVLAANIPAEYGIETVDGYDGGILPLKRYAALKDLLMPVRGIPADNQLRNNLTYAPPMQMLDLLNVRYLLATKLQDTRVDNVYYDRGISIILDPGQTERLRRMPDLSVTSIGLITSTEGAREQEDGVPAASLTLADRSGVTLSLPLRMGMETGETPERDAQSKPPAHRKPRLVESWSPKEKSTEYHSKITLPVPLDLKEIAVKNLLGGAKLRIRAITLIDDRTGTSVPLVLSDRMDRQLFFDMKLYTVRDPLPRAFLAHNSLVRDDDRALEMLGRSQLPLDQVAILAASPTARAIYRPLPSTGETGEARLRSHEPDEVVVEVKTEQSGYLVLQDPFYPGWKATVDGAEVPIERANYFFRGVLVEPGEHTVVFRYAPTSFQMGLYVTLGSLALVGITLLALAVRALRRRPHPGDMV